jgi:AraC family ethanolamine operon transcriptional activator
MAMAEFGSVSDGAEHHTRSAHAQQRSAVERAREYIRVNLAEPLPLSKLCSYAHVQARSLEYGFREITGLAPIAYIKSLRLNAVRRALLRTPAAERSISEIALDNGFWHLSQFAADYRKFFGETPTSTRQGAPSRR